MAGISLVGLSGSMIKDAVKEADFGTLDDAPSTEPAEQPEVTKVLVGTWTIRSQARASIT